MAGLTPQGFVAKTTDELRAELEAAVRARLGADIDVGAESVFGHVIAVATTHYASLWELVEAVFNARDPRAAAGRALDVVAELCPGIPRLGETKGTVTLRVSLNAGVTLAAGAVAHVTGDPTSRWRTTAAATNGGGAPAQVDVAAECELAGRRLAPSGTIAVIATPSPGWTAVTNPADADPGREVESDAALRLRREDRLQQNGTSPLAAIRAALAAVDGVTDVVVWENVSDFTDDDGRPPHSVEAMVLGGTNAAIARALWDAKAGGIRTYGTTGVVFTDDNGEARTVYFSRPSDLAVYCTIKVAVDADVYAGDAAVEQAVLDAAEGYGTGEPVLLSDLILAARAVTGVRDVQVYLGTSASFTAQRRENLAAGTRQRAVFDSSRTSVEAL